MGKIANVSKSVIDNDEREIISEVFPGYSCQTPQLSPCNIDTAPIQGDKVYTEKLSLISNSNSFAVGYIGKSEVEEGEIKIYSRASNGDQKAIVYLKNTGEIEIKNDAGSIIIDETGKIEIKGLVTLLQALTTTFNAIKAGVIDPSNYAFNGATVAAIEAGLLQLNQVLK